MHGQENSLPYIPRFLPVREGVRPESETLCARTHTHTHTYIHTPYLGTLGLWEIDLSRLVLRMQDSVLSQFSSPYTIDPAHRPWSSPRLWPGGRGGGVVSIR